MMECEFGIAIIEPHAEGLKGLKLMDEISVDLPSSETVRATYAIVHRRLDFPSNPATPFQHDYFGRCRQEKLEV
jgi:hypothetical protein